MSEQRPTRLTSEPSEAAALSCRLAGERFDGPDSDIDLLIDLPAGTSLFSIARLEKELSDLLAAKVDVVSAGALRDHVADHVLREAVPL